MVNTKPPMSSRSIYEKEKYEREDYKSRVQSVNGADVKVTDYRDGSTTYHFGAMGGTINYDRYGNEC